MIDVQNAESLWAVTVFTVPFMVLKLCTLDMCYVCSSALLIALKIARMAGHGVSHSPLYIWKYEVNINKMGGIGIIKLENNF